MPESPSLPLYFFLFSGSGTESQNLRMNISPCNPREIPWLIFHYSVFLNTTAVRAGI